MKRVFVGIKSSDTLKDRIGIWRERKRGLPVRFIDHNNLHVTLVPPWYVQSNELDKVLSKLDYIRRNTAQFRIKFNRLDVGPDLKKPRLIWIRGNSGEEIVSLVKTLSSVLDRKNGIRKFLIHLTVARFKPSDFKSFASEKPSEEFLWSEVVDNFTLFESKLLRSGAEYTVIKEFKFTP